MIHRNSGGSRDATALSPPSPHQGDGGTVSPLHQALSLRPAVPRGFATSRIQTLTSMGVRPTRGLKGRWGRRGRDAILSTKTCAILRNPRRRAIARADRPSLFLSPFLSLSFSLDGGERLATPTFPISSKKAWVWRANRKLGQYRVPSVFLFCPNFHHARHQSERGSREPGPLEKTRGKGR